MYIYSKLKLVFRPPTLSERWYGTFAKKFGNPCIRCSGWRRSKLFLLIISGSNLYSRSGSLWSLYRLSLFIVRFSIFGSGWTQVPQRLGLGIPEGLPWASECLIRAKMSLLSWQEKLEMAFFVALRLFWSLQRIQINGCPLPLWASESLLEVTTEHSSNYLWRV